MSIEITWEEGPVYPMLIKGPAVGAIDGRLFVAGGMSYPWREVENGFWLATEYTPKVVPSLAIPGEEIKTHLGEWYPLPPLPIGPGWTSGSAVAGGLAVVGGRRRFQYKKKDSRATSDVWFLDVLAGATNWERLPDRPSPAMVATTFADGDLLYTAFGTDWQPHEHATGDPNIYRMNARERSSWEAVARFPGMPRWLCGMAVCNNKMYVIGGLDKPVGGITEIQPHNAYDGNSLVTFGEMWEYDFDTDVWQELPHPPRAFVSDAFTVSDRWIVLTGGRSWVVHPEGVAARIMRYVPELDCLCRSYEVWAYDTHTGEWLSLDPLPYGVSVHRVATWEDRVFIVGNETTDPKRGNAYGTVFEGRIIVN